LGFSGGEYINMMTFNCFTLGLCTLCTSNFPTPICRKFCTLMPKTLVLLS
jgi:hypothetical protein